MTYQCNICGEIWEENEIISYYDEKYCELYLKCRHCGGSCEEYEECDEGEEVNDEQRE